MTVAPVRLNHAVLYVADVERAVRFYTEVLGMEVVQAFGTQAAFLRSPRSGNHHDLGLFGIGSRFGPKRPGIGLYHLAWQVDTIDELVQVRRALVEAGALAGQSDHGATKSLYAHDPDGNEFEVMWMLPRAEWGAYEKDAPTLPLDLDAEVRRWTGVSTGAELTPTLG